MHYQGMLWVYILGCNTNCLVEHHKCTVKGVNDDSGGGLLSALTCAGSGRPVLAPAPCGSGKEMLAEFGRHRVLGTARRSQNKERGGKGKGWDWPG